MDTGTHIVPGSLDSRGQPCYGHFDASPLAELQSASSSPTDFREKVCASSFLTSKTQKEKQGGHDVCSPCSPGDDPRDQFPSVAGTETAWQTLRPQLKWLLEPTPAPWLQFQPLSAAHLLSHDSPGTASSRQAGSSFLPASAFLFSFLFENCNSHSLSLC